MLQINDYLKWWNDYFFILIFFLNTAGILHRDQFKNKNHLRISSASTQYKYRMHEDDYFLLFFGGGRADDEANSPESAKHGEQAQWSSFSRSQPDDDHCTVLSAKQLVSLLHDDESRFRQGLSQDTETQHVVSKFHFGVHSGALLCSQ